VLTQPQGFTRRTIKDENGELLWEVFCKPHAAAVSEPLKPKPKTKLQDSASFEEVEEETVVYETVVKNRKGEYKGKDDHPKHPLLSMSHALNFTSGNNSSQTHGRPGLTNFRQASVLRDDDEDDEIEDDEDDDDGENDAKKKKKMGRAAGKGKAPIALTRSFSSSSAPLTSSSSVPSYPIHTMSEWPGQTEGEAMDLSHFWNVVSMSFPEDHTSEVSYLKQLIIIIIVQ